MQHRKTNINVYEHFPFQKRAESPNEVKEDSFLFRRKMNAYIQSEKITASYDSQVLDGCYAVNCK